MEENKKSSFVKASEDKEKKSTAKKSSPVEASENEGKISIEDINKQLEECHKKRDEYLAGWQRAKADFINYKKDETGRLKEFLKYGIIGLLIEFLPILDNFEKAEKETPEEIKNNQYFKGLLQIKIQIQDFLKSQGVTAMESIGKKVDLNFHEIVGEVEMKDKEPGEVVEEVQKGYLIEDKLLRPAKVKIVK